MPRIPAAMDRERIVVGMSGGVDSSVAAALLVEAGFDVVGVTLRVWPWREPDDARAKFGSCCSAETVDDARQVARRLGIPYYLLNSEQEFSRVVIDEFQREYEAGRTPVPCVACNRDIKFGSLLGRARAWDASAVASGHYARITRAETSGRYLLLRAVDPIKDQTDFLWPLTQEQLSRARFPVGHLTKRGRAGARARARARHGRQAREPGDLLHPRRRLPGISSAPRARGFPTGTDRRRRGRQLLGHHAGLPDYTVGQRRGLGLASGRRPLYVTRLDPATNTVVVGTAADVDAVGLRAERVNLIAMASLDGPLAVTGEDPAQPPAGGGDDRSLRRSARSGARRRGALHRASARGHSGPVSRLL